MSDLYYRETDCSECGPECRTLVLAANTSDQRGPDGYGHKGEYLHVSEFKLEDGATWGGEQCGDCGNDIYTITRKRGSIVHFVVVCTGDDCVDGCGRETPIIKVQSHYVVF